MFLLDSGQLKCQGECIFYRGKKINKAGFVCHCCRACHWCCLQSENILFLFTVKSVHFSQTFMIKCHHHHLEHWALLSTGHRTTKGCFVAHLWSVAQWLRNTDLEGIYSTRPFFFSHSDESDFFPTQQHLSWLELSVYRLYLADKRCNKNI